MRDPVPPRPAPALLEANRLLPLLLSGAGTLLIIALGWGLTLLS